MKVEIVEIFLYTMRGNLKLKDKKRVLYSMSGNISTISSNCNKMLAFKELDIVEMNLAKSPSQLWIRKATMRQCDKSFRRV